MSAAVSSPVADRASSPGRRKQSSLFAPNQRAVSPVMATIGNTDANKVKRNAKGGVLVTPEEIAAAFQLLDSEKSGSVSLASLKKKLGVFFPELSAKDYRFLMNNKKDLAVEDLEELLLDNDVMGFDPVAEAFKAFDAAGDGKMDLGKMREVFVAFGLGQLTDEELDILKRAADIDGDGAVTLDDFRALSNDIKFSAQAERERLRSRHHAGGHGHQQSQPQNL